MMVNHQRFHRNHPRVIKPISLGQNNPLTADPAFGSQLLMAILPFLLDYILLNQLNQLHLTPKLSWQNSSKSLKNTCQFPFQTSTSLQAAAALAQKQRLQAATTGGNPFSTGGCSDPGGLVDFWTLVFFGGISTQKRGFISAGTCGFSKEHGDFAKETRGMKEGNVGIQKGKIGDLAMGAWGFCWPVGPAGCSNRGIAFR